MWIIVEYLGTTFRAWIVAVVVVRPNAVRGTFFLLFSEKISASQSVVTGSKICIPFVDISDSLCIYCQVTRDQKCLTYSISGCRLRTIAESLPIQSSPITRSKDSHVCAIHTYTLLYVGLFTQLNSINVISNVGIKQLLHETRQKDNSLEARGVSLALEDDVNLSFADIWRLPTRVLFLPCPMGRSRIKIFSADVVAVKLVSRGHLNSLQYLMLLLLFSCVVCRCR
ncbi:Protein of unknown function [Cotesia congregata]|uniref:Uncharacterized protein n=1 Tax=Cotesia congregata TaxID=51543 RepID=A0A8J2HCW1_COTCN|nr:Protein of unknown function [Cotesia congregata]